MLKCDHRHDKDFPDHTDEGTNMILVGEFHSDVVIDDRSIAAALLKLGAWAVLF